MLIFGDLISIKRGGGVEMMTPSCILRPSTAIDRGVGFDLGGCLLRTSLSLNNGSQISIFFSSHSHCCCMSLNSSSQKWVFYSSCSTHLWLLFGFAIYTSSILKLLCFWWITFSLFNSFTTPPQQTLVGCSCSRWRVAWQSIEGFVELPLMSLSFPTKVLDFGFVQKRPKTPTALFTKKDLLLPCFQKN